VRFTARALGLGAGLVLGAVLALPAGARTGPQDAQVERRVVEGIVIFPESVGPAVPFVAIRSGRGLVWLDLRPMASPPPPLRAGDRIVADAYPTTRGDVLIPVEIRTGGGDQASAAPRPVTAADPLAGAWSGHWVDSRDGRRRAAELIILPGREASSVVGQLTLLRGARAWTARYAGVAADGAARFELPEGGQIVVRGAGEDRLTGEFAAPGGSLPAPAGSLELSRMR
jgi:hypothetical protein